MTGRKDLTIMGWGRCKKNGLLYTGGYQFTKKDHPFPSPLKNWK